MDKEKFLESIKELGLCEDDVERRSMLANISEEVSKIYDSNKELSESNNKYIEDMEKLRQANMELFLRVGDNKTPDERTHDETGIVEEKPLIIEKSFSDFANDFLNK